MDLNLIRETVRDEWSRVESLITEALNSDIDILNQINGYVLSHSGKQLRPLLSLVVARACSGGHTTEASLCYAAAVELLHNATLLHDDVADNSDERRGAPTVRAMMGPSSAVLVGDFWLVRAVQMVLECEMGEAKHEVAGLFSKTLCDLSEGEMLQLQKSSTGDTDEEDCRRIIYSKTASLFETSATVAAISVAADEEFKEAVKHYGRALGMAFQIRDDIFDYTTDASEVGKPVGADVCEGLITLPLLGALRQVSPDKEREIRHKVVTIGKHPEYRDEILSFVRDNGGIEYATSQLEMYVKEAVEALEPLPDSQDRRWLCEIAHYVGERHS